MDGNTKIPMSQSGNWGEDGETKTAGELMSYLGANVTFLALILALVFPIGSIYSSNVATNPATLFGVGTWTAVESRVLVGYKSGDPNFGTPGGTGGAATITLSAAEMPSHTHTQDAHAHVQQVRTLGVAGTAGSAGGLNANNVSVGTTDSTTATNQNTGGGGAHNNLQPYLTVYMWQRTA